MRVRKNVASNLSFKNSNRQKSDDSMRKRTGYLLWPVAVGMLTGWVRLYDFWFTVTNKEADLT